MGKLRSIKRKIDEDLQAKPSKNKELSFKRRQQRHRWTTDFDPRDALAEIEETFNDSTKGEEK